MGEHIGYALIEYFTYFGIPHKLVVDSRKEFNNVILNDLLNFHKIKVHFTTSAQNESNGAVERFHSVNIEPLRILQESRPNQTNLM